VRFVVSYLHYLGLAKGGALKQAAGCFVAQIMKAQPFAASNFKNTLVQLAQIVRQRRQIAL
jgi:hypothetical protein